MAVVMIASFSSTYAFSKDVPSSTIVESSRTMLSSEQYAACDAARDNAIERNNSACAAKGFSGNAIQESTDYSGQVKTNQVDELQQGYMWECTAHVVSRCATKLPDPKCTLRIAEYPKRLFHAAKFLVIIYSSSGGNLDIGQAPTYNEAYELMMKTNEKQGCEIK